MKVIVAQDAGFCYGVKRATRAAFEAAAAANGPVYTLGPLIHNPQVVARLAEQGVKAVAALEDVGPGLAVIRSHGLPPATAAALERRAGRVLDLTCPTVQAVQQRAADLAAAGYQVVIIGDRNHPEVDAIAGYAGPGALIVNAEEEATAIPPASRIGVVMQTTHAAAAVRPIVGALLGKAAELRVFNTLCDATSKRQQAALTLTSQVDVIVVVGGRNSANTTRLEEICRTAGTRTYHVETAAELEPAWFEGIKAVGVAAGTSTPDWIIEEVVAWLKGIGPEGVGPGKPGAG